MHVCGENPAIYVIDDLLTIITYHGVSLKALTYLKMMWGWVQPHFRTQPHTVQQVDAGPGPAALPDPASQYLHMVQ